MTWTLGVDFGTSNTAAAYRVDGGPALPVRLSDQAEQMPSAILALDSRILVGGAAVRSARLDPQRFEPSPKRRLGEGEILLGATEWEVTGLIAEVLTHVRQKAVRVAGGQPPSQLILTYPQQWAGGRKEQLRQAAVQAGFDPATVRLVTEPIAAASWYASTQPVPAGKCVAVFDFGGGTCDVAVLQANRDDAGTFTVLAADGSDPLGGELLDMRLLDWTLEQLAAGGNRGMVEALSAPENLGAMLTLTEQIRHAKHELAEYESAQIPVAVGQIQTIVTITSAEFDKVVGGEIDEAVTLTRRTLVASGVAPGDLHALYLTGGSSHLRLVHRRMTELLGRPPATLNDPKLVVAQGALLAPPSALESPGTGAPAPAPATKPAPTPTTAHAPRPAPTPTTAHAPTPVPASASSTSQKPQSKKPKWLIATAIAVVVAMVATVIIILISGSGDGVIADPGGDPGSVIIGSANSGESELLMNIYGQALEAQGVTVALKPEIGSREVYIPAVKDGSVDLVPEYSGSLLGYFDQTRDAESSADVYSALRTAVGPDLMVLDQSAAESKFTIGVTHATADKYGLKSIADLAPVAGDLSLGSWSSRDLVVPRLKVKYGVEFGEFQSLEELRDAERALVSGQVDAAILSTTDLAIQPNGFVILDDPQNLYTAQNVLPLINAAKSTPTIEAALNAVSAELTTEDLIDLNSKIAGGSDAATVAADWLTEKGLI